MSVKMRQEVERKIVGQFVRDALAAGHRLAVSLQKGYDIGEMLLGSIDLHVLKMTNGGHPGHPLYVGYDVQPIKWNR